MPESTMDLPKLIKLEGEANLQHWKRLLQRHLTLLDLEKYILEDQGITEANKKERNKALLFIESSLSQEAQNRLRSGGSKEFHDNPKDLYDDILRILPMQSENAIAEMIDEFCSIRRKTFTTFHKFLDRLQHLRMRIRQLIPEFVDSICVWIALSSVKEYHFYSTLMVAKKENKLKWEDFTRQLLVEANREGADTTLLAQPRTGSVGSNNDNRRKGQWQVHEACGKKHSGGDEKCWELHPEQKTAYDEEMKKKKKEEEDRKAGKAPRPAATSTNFNSDLAGAMFQLASPTASSLGITKDSLVLDSGASAHTFNDPTWFTTIYELPEAEVFGSANGGEVVTKHKGTVTFSVTTSQGTTTTFNLGAVYSPSSPFNLLSTGTFKDDGAVVDGFNDQLVRADSGAELVSIRWINKVAVLRDAHLKKNKINKEPTPNLRQTTRIGLNSSSNSSDLMDLMPSGTKNHDGSQKMDRNGHVWTCQRVTRSQKMDKKGHVWTCPHVTKSWKMDGIGRKWTEQMIRGPKREFCYAKNGREMSMRAGRRKMYSILHQDW
jgi:hypothetical protein